MSLTGQQIGKFRVGPLLGEGGMAQVYLGEQMGFPPKVAIKVLLAEHCANEQVVARFINEGRALGRITHPGVVSVFDLPRLPDGRVCIIMELLSGQTLRSVLQQRGRLGVDEALHLTIQIADALAAAHDQKIIHRDIKPDNVFVIVDAAGMRTKIVDFGIAKLVGDSSLVRTGTQAQLGTMAYMSPEQFRSSKDVDHRADMYSLGCMLFEMLCGQTPFVANTLVDYMRMHAMQPPPLLRAVLPMAPVALEQVLQRLLAKNPAERFGSMRELKQILEVIQAGGTPMLPPPGQVIAPVVPAAYPGSGPAPGSSSAMQPVVPMPASTQARAEPADAGGTRWLVIAITAVVVVAAAIAAIVVLG